MVPTLPRGEGDLTPENVILRMAKKKGGKQPSAQEG